MKNEPIVICIQKEQNKQTVDHNFCLIEISLSQLLIESVLFVHEKIMFYNIKIVEKIWLGKKKGITLHSLSGRKPLQRQRMIAPGD